MKNIIDDIDHFLVERERKKKESHYPSEAMDCRRKAYYRWTEESESNPIEASALWKMRFGELSHDMIKGFLESSGYDIIHEQPFKMEVQGLRYKISGRLDDLFVDEDGEVSGIEIKSSYGRGIVDIQRKQEPKIEHSAQVLIYMQATNIKKFYLIYVGRDNGYRTQFLYDYRAGKLCANGKPVDLTFEFLVQRYKDIERAVAEKQLPPREFIAAIKNHEIKDKFQKDNVEYKSNWQCSYCQYRNKCWANVIVSDGDNSEMFKERSNG